jgi:hypothetical protein
MNVGFIIENLFFPYLSNDDYNLSVASTAIKKKIIWLSVLKV